MKWIGLTGGLGTGKSTVADILRRRGYPVIDADQIAKEVVAPGTSGLRSVLAELGADLLKPDGSLDRGKLAQQVFSDREKLEKLETIIHPLVQDRVREIRKALQAQGFQKAFYDVPLLFEKNLSGFDEILVVTSDPVHQRERLRARNGWSDEEITRRTAAQWPMDRKVTSADHVIKNDAGLSELEKEVDAYLSKTKPC